MAEGGYIPTQRFLDVNYEPQQNLSPIQGYELKPIVSLEEAVRPLEPLITNVQGFVWTAIGNCQQTKDGLIPNERAAIYLYTMDCLYSQLNIALRDEDRDKLKPYFSYLKLFLTALWKLSDVNGTVWRGVKMNLSDQYPNGKKFIWWGLSSCTTSLDILQKNTFLGEIGPRTLFNIQCFNGKSIGNHSKYPSESEILLLPCSHFEVMGRIKQGSDLCIIHLQQREPRTLLIQPPFKVKLFKSKMTNLNFDVLKNKPRLSISISYDWSAMAANDKYLLYCPKDSLSLIDTQGHGTFNLKRDFWVKDMCWSSYLNQFLILEGYNKKTFYSLDINANETQQLKHIKEFRQEMRTCTCYEERFFISSMGDQSIIEEYNQSDWKLIQTHNPPHSSKQNEQVIQIRFNSNGTYLGVILEKVNQSGNPFSYWFELRNPNDMNVLQILELSNHWCDLLSLSNEQFLVNTGREKKILLINSDGQLEESIYYYDVIEQLRTSTLINNKCLVIQTNNPDELRFFDL